MTYRCTPTLLMALAAYISNIFVDVFNEQMGKGGDGGKVPKVSNL